MYFVGSKRTENGKQTPRDTNITVYIQAYRLTGMSDKSANSRHLGVVYTCTVLVYFQLGTWAVDTVIFKVNNAWGSLYWEKFVKLLKKRIFISLKSIIASKTLKNDPSRR
jgi:hypothetical protein